MLLTGKNTAIVSSTDLKRNYKSVKKLLNKNTIIIITNKNNINNADGILFPYSEPIISKIEDLMEDQEMEAHKQNLIKELEESYKSGKKKRISLDEI